MELGPFLDSWLARAPAVAHRLSTDRRGKPLPKRWAFYRLRRLAEAHLRERAEPRVILVPGLRGVGKTTLLCQLFLSLYAKGLPVFYLPVDRLYRSVGPVLLEALEKISSRVEGPKVILLDEVTHHRDWAGDLKLAYDYDPDLMVVAAGSSALAMRADVDLSRRAGYEPLFPLSLSEYLLVRGRLGRMRGGLLGDVRTALLSSDAEELIELEGEIRRAIRGDPIAVTESFLEVGGLPATARARNREIAAGIVVEVLDRVVRWDLVEVASFESDTLPEVERVLAALASEKPGAVSMESLSRDLGINKRQVRRIVEALERAEVIFRAPPVGPARGKIRRAWKVYFTTPTLRWGQLMDLMPGGPWPDPRSTLLEEAVAARLHRIVGTRRAASLAYGWIDGEVDLVLEAAGRRVAFEVGLGKRLPRRQARAAEELGVDVTYVVTLRPGVSEERGAVYVPAWLVLF